MDEWMNGVREEMHDGGWPTPEGKSRPWSEEKSLPIHASDSLFFDILLGMMFIVHVCITKANTDIALGKVQKTMIIIERNFSYMCVYCIYKRLMRMLMNVWGNTLALRTRFYLHLHLYPSVQKSKNLKPS